MTTKNDLESYISFISEYYLSVRPRSEKEMRDYLSRKLLRKIPNAEDREAMIQDRIHALIERTQIDDNAFAQWYVEEKSRAKLRGPVRLQIELRAKGIPDELIEKALSQRERSDGNMLAQILASKYAAVNINDQKSRAKMVQGLLRRGYQYSDIKKSIEEYWHKE